MASMDKQQQLQLELNVLKEREKSRKALEKYSKKHPGLNDKENHAEYDWSRATGKNTRKASKKLTDSYIAPKESRDDSDFVGTAKKRTPHRPLSISLSDSEIGFPSKFDKMGLETMTSDVREVLNSLAVKGPESRNSSKRETRTRNKETSSASAREKFDKLNKLYQRVTGDKSIRSALEDDDSDASDSHVL